MSRSKRSPTRGPFVPAGLRMDAVLVLREGLGLLEHLPFLPLPMVRALAGAAECTKAGASIDPAYVLASGVTGLPIINIRPMRSVGQHGMGFYTRRVP